MMPARLSDPNNPRGNTTGGPGELRMR